MKSTLCACLLVVCAIPAPAATLKEARRQWLTGEYGKARESYEALVKEPKLKAAASLGLSRVLVSKGEYDAALQVLDDALKDEPRNAILLAAKADLLYQRGRWEEAEKTAEAAIAIKKDQFLAHWVRAQVYRDRGEQKKADEECRWFVRAYNAADEVKDPEALRIIGLAAAEWARWHRLPDQLDFVLNELYAEALKIEPAYWPAEYESGMLLLEAHNRPEALKALDKAEELNLSAAEVLAAKGEAALLRFEIKDAETLAERALKVNPNLPQALRLRADVHLATGDVKAALRELETARKINPRDERTLGRVAACLVIQGKKAEVDAIQKEVEKQDSRPAVFHYEKGLRLEDRRRYGLARVCFETALKLRPEMSGPANNLGLLLMRLGLEDQAAKVLATAFDSDKFNKRVSNQRKVLRHLKDYQTILTKGKHFRLRYDPKTDAALARFMADYLETIYEDLAKKFDFRPKEPILIEVFNNHMMFSGRVIALPDLHTVGACTGRMIALASPNGRGVARPYNWARVLRHEVVHVFNLEQTNFLVPHWLTEGLAVSNEGFPRPPVWNALLLERVPTGKGLLNLDTVDLGFIRPRTRIEWNLAYCQSQLYVDYLKKTYGADAVGKLLAAYADGLDTAAAIERVCKVDKAAFEKGYRAYLETIVKGLRGRPPEKARSFAEAQEAYEKDKANPDLAAELALKYLARRNRTEARKLAQQALEAKKNQPTACYVLSRLAHAAGDEKEERRLLETGLDRANPDLRLLKALGRLYYETRAFAQAADLFELGHKAEPNDPEWLMQLAKVYAQTGDKAKQITTLTALVPLDSDDFDRRMRLAKLLLEEKRYPEAEKYAREALEINIKSAPARTALDKALREQRKDAEADRIREMLGAK